MPLRGIDAQRRRRLHLSCRHHTNFCVGLHNQSWLSNGIRRYKVFVVVVGSGDGVVRSFQLTVTGHHTWSDTKIRVIQHFMGAADFAKAYGTVAWTLASAENQGGCYDIHP